MGFDVSRIFADQVHEVSKSDTGRQLITVDIDDLTDNAANFYAVTADGLEELKNSIALSGIMDPPTVTKIEDGKYRLISGHRRTAAVRALVAEGREDLRCVPVFVRSPKSAAMEELELIMANSTARVLSSAEVSQAAQRVERLLYELKEQGVEFPGRMRDHVAAACNVSRTKLANLHTIEANLIQDFKSMWADGKIPDTTALELARCDIAFQMRIRDAFANIKEFPTSAGIQRIRELAKNGAHWQPDMHCPDRKLCPSSRGNAMLRHDALLGPCEQPCKGETCCMKCKYGSKADSWNACNQMCSRAKQYRSDKCAEARKKEEDKETVRQRGYQKAIQRDAQRIAFAADASGISDDVELQFDNYGRFKTVGKIRQYAIGNFEGDHFYGIDALRPDIRHVTDICKLLHCSADYLLDMTDVLQTGTPTSESSWRRDTDYPDGDIVAAFQTPGAPDFFRTILHADSGMLYFSSNGTQVDEIPTCWLPIPDMEVEIECEDCSVD